MLAQDVLVVQLDVVVGDLLLLALAALERGALLGWVGPTPGLTG